MTRILLLNSIYEPVNFIGERKALSLILRGVVETVSFWEEAVLLQQSNPDKKTINMPATLRLTKWYNRITRLPQFRRHVVFARDDYKCQYCFKLLSTREATIDHVIPKNQGGKLIWKNAVTSCKVCNRYKGNKTPEQAGMILLNQPSIPTIVHFWNVRHDEIGWHPSWNDFIPR